MATEPQPQPTEQAVAISPEELEAQRQELLDLEKSDPTIFQRVVSDVTAGAKEAPGQVVRGAAEAVNEATSTAFGLARWVNDNIVDLGHLDFGKEAQGSGWKGVVTWSPGMGGQYPALFEDQNLPEKPKSVTGGIVNDLTQFAVGFAVAGKALKAAGMVTEGAAAAFGQGLAKGAVADAAFMDPHEERLSNLVEQYPSLSNPVTRFLAADPNDGEAMGRFKNAIEGMGLGVAAEGLLHGVKALAQWRRGDKAGAQTTLDEMAGKVQDNDPIKGPEPEAPKAPEGEQLELGLEGGGAGKDSPRPMVEENPTGAAPDLKAKKDSPELKPVKKLVEVDDAALRDLVSARIADQGFGQGKPIAGIRTDLIENGEDINSILNSIRRVYHEEYPKAVGGNADGVRTFENVQRNVDRLSDIVGDDPRLMMQRMRAKWADNMHLDAEVRMYEDFLATVGQKVYDLADLVADPLGGTGKYATRMELMQDFAKHYELMANVQLMYKGIQTNIARSLNAFKIGAKVNKELLAKVTDPDELFQGGARNMEALARRIKATGGDPKALVKATQGGFVQNILGTVNEYWINAILSGLKTHVVNMASNAISTAFQPAERMLAGAIRAGTQEGRQEFIEGGLQYLGLVTSLRDAVSLSAKAFKLGDSILDPAVSAVEHQPFITSQRYGISNPVAAFVVDGLGTTVRLPSRFLTAEDEFFKQLNYRAEVRAQAYREAVSGWLHNDPKRFAEYVSDALDNSIDPKTGRGVNDRAIQNARSATFQESLKADTWASRRTLGETLQQFAEAHPGVRLIAPFVRTPTNLMRFVWNRTPGLNLLRKQYLDDFMGKSGDAAAGKAFAQMTTGAALWGTAISYAADGDITGYGPRDPDIRKQLKATGWQPYSIRTKNEDGTVTYRSYDRFDPFGMFFGLAADYAEVINSHPEETREEIAMGLVVALTKNLNNKSYLSGIVQALSAFADPDRKSEPYLRNLAGSFIPSFLNQQLKDDPYMREVRTVMDALHARTPGYSDTVDPQRNILGEKIHVPTAMSPEWLSPIAKSVHMGGDQPTTQAWKEKVQTDVYDELARQMFIHNAQIRPPAKTQGQVDFTQYRRPDQPYTAYDRYQELTGQVVVNGKNLKDTLQAFIASPKYQEKMTDGDYHYDGSRIDTLKSIIGGFRMKAEQQLRKEFPDLDLALKQEEHRKALWKVRPKEAAALQ